MKKLFTLFAALMFTTAMSAQLGRPTWSVFAGAGTQTIVGQDKKNWGTDGDIKPNFAWTLGAEARIPLMGSDFGATWLANAAIGTRGFHDTYKGGNKYETTEWIHTFNIQLAPFMFGWNFDLRSVSIMPFAGPYVSFDFAGTQREKGKWDDGEKLDEKVSIWHVRDVNKLADNAYMSWYDESAKKWKRGHQFIDVGLNFGANVYFAKRFYAGATFQAGFMQMIKKKAREYMFTDEDGSKKDYKYGTSFTFLCRFGFEF